MFGKDFDNNEIAGRLHGFGRQARRGDMRLIILHVLKDQSMHGYEVIRHLEEKSHGLWRPSPGSIYPTLQMLEEEGLVESSEIDGKRVYKITETGRKEAKNSPHEHWQKFEDTGSLRQLHQTSFELMHQLKGIVRNKNEADMAAALKILERTGEELSAIMKDKEGTSDAK